MALLTVVILYGRNDFEKTKYHSYQHVISSLVFHVLGMSMDVYNGGGGNCSTLFFLSENSTSTVCTGTTNTSKLFDFFSESNEQVSYDGGANRWYAGGGVPCTCCCC